MTIYTAHIVTAEASGLGEPGITIMTGSEDGLPGDYVTELPLDDDQSPAQVLDDAGWRIAGEQAEAATGYVIVDVAPLDRIRLVETVTSARAQAQAELDRQDRAWRTVIRDAMLDESTSKVNVAEAARISRERAYQIRDGRR